MTHTTQVLSDEQIDTVSLAQWGPHHGAPLAAHRAYARAIIEATLAALGGRDLDAAAKVLAARMDYPWEHMPEQGRQTMRENAKAVIDAALPPTQPAPAPVDEPEPVNMDKARAAFESISKDSHNHQRSVRGTYRNPPVARDWKWFQLGIFHATEGSK